MDKSHGCEIIKAHFGNVSKSLLQKILYIGMSESDRNISFLLKSGCEYQSRIQEIIIGAQESLRDLFIIQYNNHHGATHVGGHAKYLISNHFKDSSPTADSTRQRCGHQHI